ncbi:MAG: hypothetical protein A2V77_12450 [Anaeromyxobacter sp. RBG_16_69_14]|nr:MAG: hypothetical protein A2V77_12450 [Anaeromyxobacter sp. RBG_16_69_14]
MLSLQPGPEDAPFPCDDCGGATYVLRGGVRDGARDRAVYLAARTEGHRPIAIAVSLGRFGEGTGPGDRLVVTLLARLEEEGIELMAVDPERCPFECAEVLGRQLGRADALTWDGIDEVFQIAELVANQDPRVKGWLALTAMH